MRARTITRTAAFLVTSILVLTSCGSGPDVLVDQAGGPADLPAPAAVPPAVPTAELDDENQDEVVDDAEPDPAPVTTAPSAATALLAQASAQELTGFAVTLAMEMGGFEEFDGEIVGFSAQIATSADGSRSRFVMDMGDLMQAAADASGEELPPELADALAAPIEVREVDGTGYVSSGLFRWLLPVETPWLSYPAGSTSTGFDAGAVDPAEFVAVLDALGDEAEIVGGEQIDGVMTTHVRGRLTAEALAAAGDGDFLDSLDMTDSGLLDVAALDLDAWLSADGGVRRIVMGLDDINAIDPTAPPGSFVRFTVDIVELDGPLAVEAPPAADVTPMADSLRFGFGD